LETTGIVVIFIVFILLQRQDLRNRLVRLAGSRDLRRTTAAIDDAAQRLSQLFLTQLALNASFGLVIGIGLWIIGVPSPALWGILAMVLRFVPYIGPPISAIFPLCSRRQGWSYGRLHYFWSSSPLLGRRSSRLWLGTARASL
jgi:predicted PurR-regulated permease PerM